MIEKSFLQQYATKSQTTFKNIAREYVQHLFLSNFYQLKKSDCLFFKGGTALRLIFRSPRFSEDIDLTASCDSNIFENLFQETLIMIEKEGLTTGLIESKQTTGGHLAIIETRVYDEKLKIKIEASQRKKKAIQGEKTTIASDIFPSYTLQNLAQPLLISEKIDALLTRHKSRDFFDLYYILRARLGTEVVVDQRAKILKLIEKTKDGFADLKQFLPKNFWPIIKELRKNLTKELNML